MANRRYEVNETTTIKLEAEVKLTSISNYSSLSEQQQQEAIEEFKKEIGSYLSNLISNSYSQAEVVFNCDYVNFSVTCKETKEE